MAILFASNSADDFAGGTETVAATDYDGRYVSSAIKETATNDTAGNVIFSWPESSGEDTWIHYDMFLNTIWLSNVLDGQRGLLTDGTNDILEVNHTDNFEQWELSDATLMSPKSLTPDIVVFTTDIHINISGGTLTATVYYNGNKYGTASMAWVNGKPTTYNFGGNDFVFGYFAVSQVLVSETSTLGRKLIELRPDAVGTHTAWTGDFNNLGDDDPATVATSDTAAQRVSSNIDNWGGTTTGALEAVLLRANGSDAGAAPTDVSQFVRISSTDYDGAALGLTASNVTYLTQWAVNPATSAPWLFSELDALQIGLLSIT